jgi:olefin beta-lactone synthetase
MSNHLNISSLFFETSERQPNAIALREGSTQLSFGEFAAAVRATAAYFRRQGIGPGDRVLIFVPMSTDLYRVVMAVFQIGATAVFLDEWVSLERLRLCCRVADCKAFIADWKFRFIGFFIPEIRSIPIKLNLSYTLQQQEYTICSSEAADTALITFTTGSTGTPKAARRTHAFLAHQFDALVRKMEPQTGDVVMTTLPIVLLVNFGTGATSVIARFSPKKAQRLNPSAILDSLAQYEVNTLIASPFFVRKLAESVDAPMPVTALKKIFTGGAPVFPSEAARYQAAFPQCDISVVYGSTEAEPIASISVMQLQQKSDLNQLGGLCVGVPDAHIRCLILRILDEPIPGDDMPDKILPTGEIGEICVAGDHVLKAYYNNEEAFLRNKIVDKTGTIWHRTGDAGFLGTDGCLYLTGRCHQMIFRDGQWISPFLWEALLADSGLVTCGTVIQHDGELVVVAQALEGIHAPDLPTLQRCLPQNVDRLVLIPKMPMDPRHHSKIDYEAVKSFLS